MINTRVKEVVVNGITQWITVVDINELKEWDKNEQLRVIGPAGFQRVRAQVDELGVYKPLIVNSDGEILGGAGSRIKVYREKGMNEVWVSVVDAQDENRKLKYNVSDNDSPGFYNAEGIANHIDQFEIDRSQYSVQIEEPITLSELSSTPVDGNSPSDGTASNNKEPQVLVCPECGHEGERKDFSTK